jgi:Flp pilus assembly protein TadD
VHNTLGATYGALNRLDEAVVSYRTAISLMPDYAPAYTNLGMALFDQGGLDEAIYSLRKALTLKPSLAEASGNLGRALLRLGHHTDGLESILRDTGFIRFTSKSEIKLILAMANA